MITESAKYKIINLFDALIAGIENSANELTLDTIFSKSKPLTLELFANNVDEYIYFIVSQRVTKSFSTRLGGVIEKVSAILVESQGGKIIPGSPNPFDLKFFHPDGKQYWIEIKSINAQNSSNIQTINERKKLAESSNCTFRLCMYNDDSSCAEEYKLNGNQFWKLVGGYEDAGKDMLAMLSGLAVTVSIREIINNKVQELVRDYNRRLAN
ncbi:MAG: hypothetical protein WA112_03165 [Rugosibacter sp.]|jgi:hypothetical protein|nr:hypothetical protein [Rugosibacter sp.]